jgi:hypothetical protein
LRMYDRDAKREQHDGATCRAEQPGSWGGGGNHWQVSS